MYYFSVTTHSLSWWYFSPSYRWRHWGLEGRGNLSEVIQQVSGLRCEPQSDHSRCCYALPTSPHSTALTVPKQSTVRISHSPLKGSLSPHWGRSSRSTRELTPLEAGLTLMTDRSWRKHTPIPSHLSWGMPSHILFPSLPHFICSPSSLPGITSPENSLHSDSCLRVFSWN